MEQGNVEQTPSVSESQVNQPQQEAPPISHSTPSSKKPLIIVGILLGFVLFGVGGYVMGMQRGTQVSVTDEVAVSTLSPTATLQPSPTSAVVPTITPINTQSWQTKQVNITKETAFAGKEELTISFKLPSDWNLTETPRATNPDYLITNCTDYIVSNSLSSVTLTISPVCIGWSAEYTSIPQDAVEVAKQDNVGNDGHTSYIIRYYDTADNQYVYEEVGVDSGASLNIRTDKKEDAILINHVPYKDGFVVSRITLKAPINDNDILAVSDQIVASLKLTD